MADVSIEKPYLIPYDDEYVLVSKRRLIAGNNCVAAMANLISGLTNTSRACLIAQFAKESIRMVEELPQSQIDEQIEIITATYNEQPKKSA
ncbi:hypothetical protein FJR11_06295 [Anabaena sp. UHCC 0187]|uniref:hypothetical protein n=1 Tax=Anabaena sp. UHCC 0187 TaxID=2590018 RepID=UPI001445859A|nr:hypothetical protein [Anabaena sp. UHCC 0187]MTJ12212.1 hypothetical protein [Anabaena sp. UHCC 0187]